MNACPPNCFCVMVACKRRVWWWFVSGVLISMWVACLAQASLFGPAAAAELVVLIVFVIKRSSTYCRNFKRVAVKSVAPFIHRAKCGVECHNCFDDENLYLEFCSIYRVFHIRARGAGGEAQNTSFDINFEIRKPIDSERFLKPFVRWWRGDISSGYFIVFSSRFVKALRNASSFQLTHINGSHGDWTEGEIIGLVTNFIAPLMVRGRMGGWEFGQVQRWMVHLVIWIL